MIKPFEEVHKQFCAHLLKYLDNKEDMNEPKWFMPEHGLCANLDMYVRMSNDLDMYSHMHYYNRQFQALLHKLYSNHVIPFNYSITEYEREIDTLTVYDNPKRMAHLRKYGAE